MKYLSLFIVFFFSLQLQAQIIIEDKEEAILEAHYTKTKVSDTLKNTSWTEPMTLRVGKTAAMFYPTKKMWADSLLQTNFDLAQKIYYEMNPIGSNQEYKPMGGFEREFIFRNVKDGETMVYRRIAGDGYSYTEPTEGPIWELLPDTKDIMGYNCQLATCNYRGRIWNAWFTTEIPISEGPWKLFGQPGLVLEASDSKKHYIYNFVGVYTKNLLPVGIKLYVNYSPIKLKNREAYLTKIYKESILGSFAASMSALYGDSSNQVTFEESQYDLQETDYPHSKNKKQ